MSNESGFKIDQKQSAINTAKLCAQLLRQFDLPLALQQAEWESPPEDEGQQLLRAALPLWQFGEKYVQAEKPEWDPRLGEEDGAPDEDQISAGE